MSSSKQKNFADLNSNPDFIKRALLHFQYLGESVGIIENDENRHCFVKNNGLNNIVMGVVFKGVIYGGNFDYYLYLA